MTKKFFMIITIDEKSHDYNLLLSYLHKNISVTKLSIILQGIFLEIFFEDTIERKKIISDIIKLEVDEISLHEVLYEEFIPRNRTGMV